MSPATPKLTARSTLAAWQESLSFPDTAIRLAAVDAFLFCQAEELLCGKTRTQLARWRVKLLESAIRDDDTVLLDSMHRIGFEIDHRLLARTLTHKARESLSFLLERAPATLLQTPPKDFVHPLLIFAAHKGYLWAVDALLNHGAPVDERDFTTSTTAIAYAVWREHVHVVHRLVQGGADLSVPGYNRDQSLLDSVPPKFPLLKAYLFSKGCR
jgi:hypothetical protein